MQAFLFMQIAMRVLPCTAKLPGAFKIVAGWWTPAGAARRGRVSSPTTNGIGGCNLECTQTFLFL